MSSRHLHCNLPLFTFFWSAQPYAINFSFNYFQICLNELDTAVRIYETLEKRIRPESHFDLEIELEVDPGKKIPL